MHRFKSISLSGSPQIYSQAFFEQINQAALQSAEVVVPILMELLHPQYVVDVGCGTGIWLSVYKKFGVKKVLGIDGAYVERKSLQIEDDEFLPMDLRQSFSLPETFDLSLCLEVAEHLPKRSARGLVKSLTRLSPFIFFSAAIPGQGGVQHINEQWPEYWESLFLEAGYLMLDLIRPLIWQDPRVAWYYQQNCFLYARKILVESNDILQQLANKSAQNDMLLIRKHILAANLSLTYSLKRMPNLVMSALFRYLKITIK
jgi:SAM-dependent methyltransferase